MKKKQLTKGPNGPTIPFKKDLSNLILLAKRLLEFQEQEEPDTVNGVTRPYIREVNMVKAFQHLSLDPDDWNGLLIKHGLLDLKTSEPRGWYIIVPEEKPLTRKQLQRLAHRLSQDIPSYTFANCHGKIPTAKVAIIRASLRYWGLNPETVMPQLIKFGYLVSTNTLPVEPIAYHIFRTQAESKEFCHVHGRIT